MINGNTTAWTIEAVLKWTHQHFEQKGIESHRLDAELLLARALNVDRVFLYTHYDQPLNVTERQIYREFVKRRALREPIAYILGYKEFYGRSFNVSPATLIPRPETEHLVEAVMKWASQYTHLPLNIWDMGTGCGTIAISLASEIPKARILATDISEAALSIAQANADQHKVKDRIVFRSGDLFDVALPSPFCPFDILVSNPPYVDIQQKSNLEPEILEFEPPEALYASSQGKAVIQRIIKEAPPYVKKSGCLAIEIGSEQSSDLLASLAQHQDWQNEKMLFDLQGHARIIMSDRK